MTHPSVRTCTCGHIEADHARGGTGLTIHRGVCLRCPCERFNEQPTGGFQPAAQTMRRDFERVGGSDIPTDIPSLEEDSSPKEAA